MSSLALANDYFQQGELNKAEQLYKQLLRVNNTNIDAIWGLSKVALALSNFQRTIDLCKRGITINAQQIPIYITLAQAYTQLRRHQEAEQALLTAYQLNPKYKLSLLALAVHFCEFGDYKQSCVYITKLLAVDAGNVEAFVLLVRMKMVSLDNGKMKELTSAMLLQVEAAKSSLSTAQQINLTYSFAELYHQDQQYSLAYTYFTKANQLQRANIDFSVTDMLPYFSRLMACFEQKLINSISSQLGEIKEKKQLTPIFIVGQPRAGSTLLEQLLIGHSDIETAGELPYLAGDIAQGVLQLTGKNFPEGCCDLDANKAKLLGQHYLQRLQQSAPNANYIIDKMPANYQSIGLIKMLLPNAKIIHISRNVVDVSWSIFRNNFAAPEPYFCSLTEIALYHQQYQQVMQHWHNTLPDFICDVSYEQLVAEPASQIKEILSFCGLNYQASCLEVGDSRRYISTLSDTQLRQGIQQGNTGRWLPYKDYLQPWVNKLTGSL